MKRARAFTLVELLVVIGIIAMLISILLPALNKARAAANTVACSSNMRQIGIGMRLYAAQFRDYIPHAFVNDNGPATPVPGGVWGNLGFTDWVRLVDPFLGGKATRSTAGQSPTAKVYKCPSSDYPDAYSHYGLTWTWGSGVGLDRNGAGQCLYGTDSNATGDTEPAPLRKFSQVKQSQEVILLVEAPYGNIALQTPFEQRAPINGNAYVRSAVWSHSKPKDAKWNYLFCDGHVEFVAERQTVSNLSALTGPYNYPGKMWTADPND